MAFSSLRSTTSSALNRVRFCQRSFSVKPSSSSSHRVVKDKDREKMMSDSDRETPEYDAPTSGISRPLSEILKELNKKVPDSLIKFRHEPNGFSLKYIPWHIVNRILNLHAPEWSGEVRSINYSSDGKSVSVVYRVTLYGTDAECCRLRDAAFYLEKTYLKKAQIDRVTNFKAKEKSSDSHKIYRESTGTASVDDPGYGDPMQKAEGMAFRRACARFGLGLHLYHEDMS